MDAVLEIFDNGLEACYHRELEAGKRKAILLNYGKALDTDKLALEIFDGGIGMAGMDSSSGGIAAWAALVSLCSTCLSCLGTAAVGLVWFGSTHSMSHSDAWHSAHIIAFCIKPKCLRCCSCTGRCVCVLNKSLHLLMSVCQYVCCDTLCDLLAAGLAHLCQCCFCYVTMQKQPHVRSAHQRQSGNQQCLYAQAYAICFL